MRDAHAPTNSDHRPKHTTINVRGQTHIFKYTHDTNMSINAPCLIETILPTYAFASFNKGRSNKIHKKGKDTDPDKKINPNPDRKMVRSLVSSPKR